MAKPVSEIEFQERAKELAEKIVGYKERQSELKSKDSFHYKYLTEQTVNAGEHLQKLQKDHPAHAAILQHIFGADDERHLHNILVREDSIANNKTILQEFESRWPAASTKVPIETQDPELRKLDDQIKDNDETIEEANEFLANNPGFENKETGSAPDTVQLSQETPAAATPQPDTPQKTESKEPIFKELLGMAPNGQIGSVHEEVGDLQRMLNAAQLQGEDGKPIVLNVDNHFGKNTRDAVIAFQKETGIAPDGIVGSQVAQQLEQNYAHVVIAGAVREQVKPAMQQFGDTLNNIVSSVLGGASQGQEVDAPDTPANPEPTKAQAKGTVHIG